MRTNFKRILIVLAACGLVAAPAAVYAKDGVSGSDSSSGSSSETTSDTSGGDDSHHVIDPNPEPLEPTQAEVEQHQTQAETEGRTLIGELEAKQHKHTDAERQKNCQAAEHGLSAKLANLQKNGAKFQAQIDSVYQKALTYQSTNNLNPTGIDQLEATANSAKITSAASVSALSNLSVNLDCTSSTVANNVATFRAAAKQARDDLNAYRKAVKAVLVSLKEAASE